MDLVAQFDGDGSGSICFTEFVAMMLAEKGDSESEGKELKGHLVGFREAFNLFDKDQDSFINVTEFHSALRTMGTYMSIEEVTALVEANDDDGNGLLDFGEFVSMLTGSSVGGKAGEAIQQISDLRESFTMYDTDGDGVLSTDEIHQALKKVGLILTYEQVEAMVGLADQDGNGTLDFSEFVSMMSMKNQGEAEEEEKKAMVRSSLMS